MSDVILLRKLAFKSQLNFGKYADLTIQQLLDLGKKKYLRWVYFNCSNISFIDDILELINIYEEYRIPKPSKDLYMFEAHKQEIDKHTYGLTKHINNMKVNKNKKNDLRSEKNFEKNYFSKANLTRRNHGK